MRVLAISFALHDTTLWTIQGTPPKVRNAEYPDTTPQAPRLNAVRSDLGTHANHAQIRAGTVMRGKNSTKNS